MSATQPRLANGQFTFSPQGAPVGVLTEPGVLPPAPVAYTQEQVDQIASAGGDRVRLHLAPGTGISVRDMDVRVWGSGIVTAYGDSRVTVDQDKAGKHTAVIAHDNTLVQADTGYINTYGNSRAIVSGDARVHATGASRVECADGARVWARDEAHVRAGEGSLIYAQDHTHVDVPNCNPRVVLTGEATCRYLGSSGVENIEIPPVSAVQWGTNVPSAPVMRADSHDLFYAMAKRDMKR